jgi:hypothetical protein
MESLSQPAAESSPSPADPGPSEREKNVAYITKTLPLLREQIDILLQRYQEAGIKWHLLPFAARDSTQNEPEWTDTLDEIYSVEPDDGSLAECVALASGRLVSFTIGGQRAFNRGNKHLCAAKLYVDAASYKAMKLEEMVSTTRPQLQTLSPSVTPWMNRICCRRRRPI